MEVSDGLRDTWIIGCDANIVPEETRKNVWFKKMEAVAVATEDEASTCSANVAGGFATITYDFMCGKSQGCLQFWTDFHGTSNAVGFEGNTGRGGRGTDACATSPE